MSGLLFLCHRIPYPPNKGDKIRSYHLMRYLASRFDVYLGAFVDDDEDWRHETALRKLCADVRLCDLSPWRARLRSLSGLLTGEALSLPYYRSANLRRWIAQTVSDRGITHAVVFSSVMAQYVERQPLKHVIDFVDVDSDKWAQYSRTVSWPMSAVYAREGRRLLQYERHVAALCEASFFVSRAEADLFRSLAPGEAANVGHFNNGVDAEYFDPGRSYQDPFPDDVAPIVFTGAMDYWPNIDAVSWFVHDIFPRIRNDHPQARFYIVGSRPTASVKALAYQPGVEVTGKVTDVRPYVAHASVAVAPLRIARGIQNKVLEAMAMARPVVVTPEALEGIEARPGIELLVAESDARFAEQVGRVLANGPSRIGPAARQLVLRDYGWEDNLARVGAALGACSQQRAAAGVFDEGPATMEFGATS